MSQIVKLAPVFKDSRGRKVPGSYQFFDENDGGAGDILMIQSSLGRAARNVTIDATATMTVKFNTVHTLFPLRQHGDGLHENGDTNVGGGQEYIASGESTSYVMGAGDTLELSNEFPVSDIMIVAGGTDFEILVS